MTDQKNKSGLDEQTFQKLLEAASVLQKHNRGIRKTAVSPEPQSEQFRGEAPATEDALRKNAPPAEENTRTTPDYSLTLAEIVEAQHQIQIRHLESDQSMALVAERIARITKASGAAIGILEGTIIRYRAGAGAALPLGSEVSLETAICADTVQTGKVLRAPDVNTALLFDPAGCMERGIQSLVAVPIYHDGNIAGALELYFDRVNGFIEQDIHTCQLMAGLVTEAISRDAGSALKKSMAAERSSMLAAIEKIKPSLAALAGPRAEASPSTKSDKNVAAPILNVAEPCACWKCAGPLIEEEQFCGKCGAPRIGEVDAASIQSKLASALHMHQASRELPFAPFSETVPQLEEQGADIANDATEEEHQDGVLQPFSIAGLEQEDSSPTESLVSHAPEQYSAEPLPAGSQTGKNNLEAHPGTLVRARQQDIIWSSASRAREFLESLARTSSPGAVARFWRARRGDFYLVVAVILVLIVIRWGILSNRSVGASGGGGTASSGAARRRSPPDADLSLFDKLLISLGLAEAPEAPEYKYKGNPNTQVWIDPHTALYYCPGSELYGKTPKGKFASQQDAQLDQFEPASRRACN
ncbi:MAG TPA: GAF domain-containing protein [Candidatus Acidoferrales bacterium]|nr:GAF domain-containing protein [Candidatus Acidoferrales bacterium]